MRACLKYLLIWCLLLAGLTSVSASAQQAEHGELSVPEWQFQDGSALAFSGEWQVIWGKLVEPVDFDAQYKGDYFSIPGTWNGLDVAGIDGARGVATFRLHLDLPSYNRDLSLHMISLNSAWRLYLNEVLIGENGNVSKDMNEVIPHYVPRFFSLKDRDSTIVIQIANATNAYGGPDFKLSAWDSFLLDRKLDFLSIYYFLAMGVLLTIAMFNFIFYVAGRNHVEQGLVHFWFSFLCFIVAARISAVIPLLHMYTGDSLYWSNGFFSAIKISYVSLFLATGVIVLFFQNLFSDIFPHKITKVIYLFNFAFAAFIVIAPEQVYTQFRSFMFLETMACVLYTIFYTLFALRGHKKGALALLVANGLFFCTAAHDVYIYTRQGGGFDWVPFGFVILCIGYSYALFIRLRRTYQKVKETSNALEIANTDLEKQVRDRTRAFKSAAAKAENHAQERAQFIAAASHDLRQPLHALAMLNAVLKRKIPKSDVGDLVDKQSASIENLGALLQDTLDSARAETGSKLPKMTEIDISSFLTKIATGYEIQAQSRNVDLSFSAGHGSIITDAGMLQRILSNLIDNALKAARSTVSVVVAKNDSSWAFSVQDDGAGIAHEDISRIFDSYVSLGDEEPGSIGGYGLGLYVVNEFTRVLGGTVKITDTSKGGTTFIVDMPTQKTGDVFAGETSTGAEIHLPSAGLKVLAIDDEPEILTAMQALLVSWSCIVHTAQTAHSAHEVLGKGFEPDVLLVDYHLYGITGLQIIKELRMQLGRDIPALIITGATEPAILTEIQAAGFEVLSKPINPDKLGVALSAIARV